MWGPLGPRFDPRRSRVALQQGVGELVEARAIEVVPRDVYAPLEQVATERVPRDQRDWPTVALAMVLNAGILTGDNDFLGCGCPTWTVPRSWRPVQRAAPTTYASRLVGVARAFDAAVR
jgi:hypothetical protein